MPSLLGGWSGNGGGLGPHFSALERQRQANLCAFEDSQGYTETRSQGPLPKKTTPPFWDWGDEMAQQFGALAILPEDLGSLPRIHVAAPVSRDPRDSHR